MESLSRSDRPEIRATRQLIEDWLQAYPPKEQPRLQSRLQSKSEDEFHSAFFELYLFTLFRTLQYEVQVPHAGAPGRKVEDFRVFRNGTLLFRMEATHVREEKKHAQQETFQKQLRGCLNEAQVGNFRFSGTVEGNFQKQPRCQRVRRQFEKWVRQKGSDIARALATEAAMDPPLVLKTVEAGATIPMTPRRFKGVARGSVGTVVSWSRGVWVMRTDRKLYKALNRKAASRYGTMAVPFLIAASVREGANENTVLNALHGKLEFLVSVCPGGGPTIPFRHLLEGFWQGPKGPRNTRVSAVLLVSQLFPWSVATTEPIVYHNPRAKHPLSPEVLPVTQMLADKSTGKYEKRLGDPIHEILGLPEHWPHHGTS